LSADDAIARIKETGVPAAAELVGLGHLEELASAPEARFVRTGSPKNRSSVLAAGQRGGKDCGLNHLAREDLIKHRPGEHWNLTPRLGQMAVENKVEAYGFPQGVLTHPFRDFAGGQGTALVVTR